MDCQLCPELSLDDWGEGLKAQLEGRRYPVSGTFELTERCNLACVHCYINQPAGNREARARELTAPHIATILDQIAEAGCLSLLLTGGEVLLRPDFPEIYRHAKQKGMLVTLFTNGTLLTPKMADFLAEWRPSAMEITLYGSTRGTYERVTQVPGSHARCMQGIELALERRLPLQLKAVLMRENCHELEEMRALAARLGVEFRYDGVLWPRLDGGQQPCAQRLSAQEVAALDRDDPERLGEWQRASSRSRGFVRSERVYDCGAGSHGFHVDCSGQLSVCMMARRPAYDLLRGSFRDGWEKFLEPLIVQKRRLDAPCCGCGVGVLCTQCPGWSQMVHGDDETPVEFVCELGRLRAAQVPLSNS